MEYLLDSLNKGLIGRLVKRGMKSYVESIIKSMSLGIGDGMVEFSELLENDSIQIVDGKELIRIVKIMQLSDDRFGEIIDFIRNHGFNEIALSKDGKITRPDWARSTEGKRVFWSYSIIGPQSQI